MDVVSAASRAALMLPPIPGVGLALEYGSRLFSQIDRPVRTVFDGSTLCANPSRTAGRQLLFTSRYHNRVERAFVKSVLRRNDYAVDVGANIGLFSMLFARIVGANGLVTAIEAEPTNACALRENLRLNEYGQVVVVEGGASDRAESLPLHLHETNLGMHSFAVDCGGGDVTVQCWPLAELVEPKPIRIMKLDIEGFEFRVLQAYFSSDAPLPTYIMLEVWDDLNQGDLVELCISRGYKVIFRSHPNVMLCRPQQL